MPRFQILKYLILLYILASFSAQGAAPAETNVCGLYKVVGKVSLTDKRQLALIVYSGTMNETLLYLEPQEMKGALEISLRMRSWASSKETVTVWGEVRKPISKMRGTLEFSKAERTLRNPLDPAGGEGMLLMEEHNCSNK